MGVVKWVFVGACVACVSTPALAVEKVVAEKIDAPQMKAAEKVVDQAAKHEPMPLDQQAQLLCEAYRVMSSYADPNYKPGVDAYGKPVVPADGGADSARAFSVPQEIQIPVNVDFAKYLGLPVEGAEMKGTVGMVSVRADGTVFYNGKETEGQLKTLCKDTKIEKENEIVGGKAR